MLLMHLVRSVICVFCLDCAVLSISVDTALSHWSLWSCEGFVIQCTQSDASMWQCGDVPSVSIVDMLLNYSRHFIFPVCLNYTDLVLVMYNYKSYYIPSTATSNTDCDVFCFWCTHLNNFCFKSYLYSSVQKLVRDFINFW